MFNIVVGCSMYIFPRPVIGLSCLSSEVKNEIILIKSSYIVLDVTLFSHKQLVFILIFFLLWFVF